jgi:RNA polymerase sigma-70 factor (ECF subfamily)
MSENNSSETELFLQAAAQGGAPDWGALLARHRDRLRRMVMLRLDQRLQGRVDPSDVIQEAFLEAAKHLEDYVRQPTMPFYLWLRSITGHKLLALHREHLGTHMRDAGREVSLYRGTLPEASSAALAAHLMGQDTRPSEAAIRAERKILLQAALNSMDAIDREVLALRHFEQLSLAEVAKVLNIKEKAAGKRYLRALERLKNILRALPGGMEGLSP